MISKKKVLVYGMTSNPGGIESFIINNFKRFTVVRLDFINTQSLPLAYEDEIKDMGGKIQNLILPNWKKSPIKYQKVVNHFFKNASKEYDCIWFNVIDLVNISLIKAAKDNGFKRIIVHSHNSKSMDNTLKGKINLIRHYWHKKQIQKYTTDFWSCSANATKWLYPKSLWPRVVLINNAIDYRKFKFNEQKRNLIRNNYRLNDNFVIGNIGRLQYQKNQAFLIDIFSCLLNYNPNSKLILIGQGPDFFKLKEKVKKLDLSKKIIFAGTQSDIPGWLSSFDIFILPSHFEGLSVVSMEAQANGIPILASTGILPKTSVLNDNVYFEKLSSSPDEWAKRILEIKQKGIRIGEKNIAYSFVKKNFYINEEAQKLEMRLYKKER